MYGIAFSIPVACQAEVHLAAEIELVEEIESCPSVVGNDVEQIVVIIDSQLVELQRVGVVDADPLLVAIAGGSLQGVADEVTIGIPP